MYYWMIFVEYLKKVVTYFGRRKEKNGWAFIFFGWWILAQGSSPSSRWRCLRVGHHLRSIVWPSGIAPPLIYVEKLVIDIWWRWLSGCDRCFWPLCGTHVYVLRPQVWSFCYWWSRGTGTLFSQSLSISMICWAAISVAFYWAIGTFIIFVPG